MTLIDKFRGQEQLIAAKHLAPPEQASVTAGKEVLAAARRVSERFGITTEGADLENALLAASSQAEYAAAFASADIKILDTDRVLEYRAYRIKPTLWQRFKAWVAEVVENVGGFLVDDSTLVLSGLIAAVITVPALVLSSIDQFWYDIAFWPSYVVAILCQGVLLVMFGATEDEEAFLPWQLINGIIIGIPVMILIALIGVWFYRGQSGREWEVKPINELDGTLPYAAALTIDQVTTAVPQAEIELEVLEPRPENGQPEFFVTIPLGKAGERLYLWHELA